MGLSKIQKNIPPLLEYLRKKCSAIFSTLLTSPLKRSWQIDALSFSVTSSFSRFETKIRVSKFSARAKKSAVVTCNLNKFYPSINDKHIHFEFGLEKLAEDVTCIKIYDIAPWYVIFYEGPQSKRDEREGGLDYIARVIYSALWRAVKTFGACGLYILTFGRLMIHRSLLF